MLSKLPSLFPKRGLFELVLLDCSTWNNRNNAKYWTLWNWLEPLFHVEQPIEKLNSYLKINTFLNFYIQYPFRWFLEIPLMVFLPPPPFKIEIDSIRVSILDPRS